MYVFSLNKNNFWEVGYYSPDGAWHASLEFSSKYEAMSFVNYLNGGAIPASCPPTPAPTKSRAK